MIAALILIALVSLGITLSHAGEIAPTVYYGSEHALAAPPSQTASYQPWIALLAILSLVTAGYLASGRLLNPAPSRS